jgi:hypothetical protein
MISNPLPGEHPESATDEVGRLRAELEETRRTALISAGLYRSAETNVSNVITLLANWRKTGPPLGTSMWRWWDQRLVELATALSELPVPDQPEPVLKSDLPCIPPPEWEFHTVLGAAADGSGGRVLLPGDMGPKVIRRRVSYGDWEPVHPDHWAEAPSCSGQAEVTVPNNFAAEDDNALVSGHPAGTGIRGLLEHVGIDTTGRDITVAGRIVDPAPTEG